MTADGGDVTALARDQVALEHHREVLADVERATRVAAAAAAAALILARREAATAAAAIRVAERASRAATRVATTAAVAALTLGRREAATFAAAVDRREAAAAAAAIRVAERASRAAIRVATAAAVAVARREAAAAIRVAERASRAAIRVAATAAVAVARREAAASVRRELGRRQDEFLGTVSHELRTPLQVVSGYAELLQARLRGPELRLVEGIMAGADQLARLVDDLLDFAQLEQGTLAVHPQAVDLTPVLRAVAADLGRLPGGERLAVVLPAALPAHADPTRVAQGVTHLIDNALKYAPEGPITLRARRRPSGGVRVDVRDRGPGLPLAVRRRVWEKFYRAPTSLAGGPPGAGIGLAVVKTVVEAHDGRVGLESAPGGGCCFWFELPAASDA